MGYSAILLALAAVTVLIDVAEADDYAYKAYNACNDNTNRA